MGPNLPYGSSASSDRIGPPRAHAAVRPMRAHGSRAGGEDDASDLPKRTRSTSVRVSACPPCIALHARRPRRAPDLRRRATARRGRQPSRASPAPSDRERAIGRAATDRADTSRRRSPPHPAVNIIQLWKVTSPSRPYGPTQANRRRPTVAYQIGEQRVCLLSEGPRGRGAGRREAAEGTGTAWCPIP